MDVVKIAACGVAPSNGCDGILFRYIRKLPRPVRFLAVGSTGFLADLAVFTLITGAGTHPLRARLVSLVLATVLTWRFNRAITFDPSGRRQSEEALRYAVVTAIAQGTNYAVFAGLVVSVFASSPQAAVIVGAAAGAGLSYTGHRLFSFAGRRAVLTHDSLNQEQEVAL
jgi:putative flippase GtrA